jgi:hypothetical protein
MYIYTFKKVFLHIKSQVKSLRKSSSPHKFVEKLIIAAVIDVVTLMAVE